MKKILKIASFTMAIILLLGIVGFTAVRKNRIEVALVTDVSDIDDKSYNEEAFRGIKKYCEEKNKKYDFFRPKYKKTDDILNAIDKAVLKGAKIVVCPNEVQAEAVNIAQKKYPNVSFLFMNGHLKEISSNTYEVNFSESELGFLAGYTAAMEGFRKLGFQGNEKSERSENYGFGFIQGAEYASWELNLGVGDIIIKYNYADSKTPVKETQARTQLWYNSDTEVIFVCGKKTLAGTISVAEAAPNRWIIGNEVDRCRLSSTVITTSEKLIADVVYSSLDDFFSHKFKGGERRTLGCKDNAIDVCLENGKLENFDYKKLQHIKEILANDINGVSTYMITSEYVKDVQIESTSDFAALFPVKSIIIEYVSN